MTVKVTTQMNNFCSQESYAQSSTRFNTSLLVIALNSFYNGLLRFY